MYEYRAIVVDVCDGNTIIVDIDLGFGVWKRGEKIRLLGIKAQDPRGEEFVKGLFAKEALERMVHGREVTIRTERDRKGKYGRYLAVVIRWYAEPECPDFLVGDNINDWMVENGYAEVYYP